MKTKTGRLLKNGEVTGQNMEQTVNMSVKSLTVDSEWWRRKSFFL